jgi:3-dehydroquinate synthase
MGPSLFVGGVVNPEPFFQVSTPHDVYDVRFGSAENRLNALIQSSKCVAIVDHNVLRLHSQRLHATLSRIPTLSFEATEGNKSWDGLQKIIRFFLDTGCTRDTKALVIGGGIVQDVSAFACHTFFRGIEWELFPTTLLSMSDSCIGGKCGINFDRAKNLVGAFESPKHVTIDTHFASTLSETDLLSGLGETLKAALLSGEEALQTFCESWAGAPLDANLEVLVRQSLTIKKRFVEEDPLDHGTRRLLNYGHTFGHALESVTNYGVPHGIAVVVGMDLINFLSVEYGLMSPETFYRLHESIAQRFKTQITLSPHQTTDLVNLVLRDKKRSNLGVNFAILKTPGNALIHEIIIDQKFRDTVQKYVQWNKSLIHSEESSKN